MTSNVVVTRTPCVDPPSSSLPTNSLGLVAATSSAPSTDRRNLQPVLASLGDTTSIYDLSTAALEQIIEEIILEENFVHMVRFIDIELPRSTKLHRSKKSLI